MEAILKFNLDEPDDIMSHYRCVKSTSMANVLFEIIYNLKKKILQNSKTSNDSFTKGVEETFKEINYLLDEQSIDIDKLIY